MRNTVATGPVESMAGTEPLTMCFRQLRHVDASFLPPLSGSKQFFDVLPTFLVASSDIGSPKVYLFVHPSGSLEHGDRKRLLAMAFLYVTATRLGEGESLWL